MQSQEFFLLFFYLQLLIVYYCGNKTVRIKKNVKLHFNLPWTILILISSICFLLSNFTGKSLKSYVGSFQPSMWRYKLFLFLCCERLLQWMLILNLLRINILYKCYRECRLTVWNRQTVCLFHTGKQSVKTDSKNSLFLLFLKMFFKSVSVLFTLVVKTESKH